MSEATPYARLLSPKQLKMCHGVFEGFWTGQMSLKEIKDMSFVYCYLQNIGLVQLLCLSQHKKRAPKEQNEITPSEMPFFVGWLAT